MTSLRKYVILYWSSGSGKEASRASSVVRRLILSPDRMPRSTPSMSCSSKSSFRQPRLSTARMADAWQQEPRWR